MIDGLYQVRYRDICAGFVVERGEITAMAPIVRRCRWLVRYARRIR